MELVLEEMEQETIELLPPRQVMCGYRPPCGCGGLEVSVDVNVDLCIGL